MKARPSLLNKIEESPCAATNIKKLQFALIASSKSFMELRQCLASNGVGRSVQKHFDLGVVSFSGIFSPRSGGYKFQNGTIAQAFQMLGLFIWYLGIWLGNQMIEPTMPVTWNHRVLVFEEHGEKSYCIHEVHYATMTAPYWAGQRFRREKKPSNNAILHSAGLP